jgi:hypothetical protein
VRRILRTPRRQYNPCPWHAISLSLETLESRTLPATNSPIGLLSPLLDAEPNDTMAQAQGLGDLSTIRRAEVHGTIGRGIAGAGDADWYGFTLDRASVIAIATPVGPLQNPLVGVLSLYGSSTLSPSGPRGQSGYRLIIQDDGAGHDGAARLDRALAAGTYFVAVTGSGNQYFHPLIAGSGFPGSAGDYQFIVTATDLGLSSTDGPVVLTANPSPGADLARSPFVIRLDLSTALDPGSIRLGSNVQLSYAANPTSGENGHVVPLASSYFDDAAAELQLKPAAPLRPGSYQVFLAGNRSAARPVLMDAAGNPFGKSPVHPSGTDFTLSFRVSGIKGNQAPGAGADDTPATAHELSELTGAGLVQIAGAIGDDPTSPIPFNRADVDLYHFHIQGAGRHALTAEVFAGRIGSPLDPALSLFHLDPSDQRLHFVAANDNSFNPTVTHDGSSAPLFTDPILNAGLTLGDYYLAVSASANVPMPAFGRLPGSGGVFDPHVSHSGKNGSTIGEYVLNVAAEPMNDPPHVGAVPMIDGTPLSQGTVLTAPPTNLSVTFDKTVNLRELVRQTGLPKVDPIYIQGRQGSKFFPQFVDYVQGRHGAEFMFVAALPNGDYQLHLSGPLGLTDLAGNPLVGNDPSGDYLVNFTVHGPARESNGHAQVWLNAEPNGDLEHSEDLGVLFPAELSTAVLLERRSAAAASDEADYYRFRVLQQTLFSFALNSSLAASEIRLSLSDASGKPILLSPSRSGAFVQATANLQPGSYVIGLSGWSPPLAAPVTYQLSMVGFSISGSDQEPVPPLSVGPAPAIRISHQTGGLPALFSPPVSGGNSSGAGSAPAASRDQGTIPSGVFLRLTAGPIGGSGSASRSLPPSDPYVNTLARNPDILLSQVIARLPLLITSQSSGPHQGAPVPAELRQWVQAVLNQFGKLSWSQTLDLFYGAREWQERVRIRPVNVLPEKMPESSQPDDGQAEARSAAGDDQNGEEILEEAAAAAWVMAAALAARTPRERGRRHGPRRVWR